MTRHVDVLIVGASLGGVAAALAAGRAGADVLLVEPSDWIGGQLTAQGVCTPDENAWIESGGCTASYQALRAEIRDHYRVNHRLSAIGLAQERLNPGSCWVSRLSAEPRMAMRILRGTLGRIPNISLVHRAWPVQVEVIHDQIRSAAFQQHDGSVLRVTPRVALDATDLGNLLPLAQAEHRLGAESRHETGEPDGPPEPRPDWIQPFTFCFALELRPHGENHTVEPPEDYSALRELQGYHVFDGAMRSMFGDYGWWDYRRVIAARNFDDAAFPCDVAMINTGSNDYRGGALPAITQETSIEVVRRARRASLGYAHWLQTECPREDQPGALGYPELRLRGDWFGTEDGIAPAPYIRESRRICAMTTVLEQDIVAADGSGMVRQPGARAALRRDSVGIGHYWLDIHAGGADEPGRFLETKPYQIPLGSLIPVRLRNLLAACKNIGVTHLANGAFRLHPVEWNVGEAAGALAAFAIERGVEAHDVLTREGLLNDYQDRLLGSGVPLYWWGDLSPNDPEWRAAQWLSLRGIWPEEASIDFRASDPVAADFPLQRPGCRTRGELATALYAAMRP